MGYDREWKFTKTNPLNSGFPLLGEGWGTPTSQKFSQSSPPGKIPPQEEPPPPPSPQPNFYFLSTKVNSPPPPLNKNVQVITQ